MSEFGFWEKIQFLIKNSIFHTKIQIFNRNSIFKQKFRFCEKNLICWAKIQILSINFDFQPKNATFWHGVCHVLLFWYVTSLGGINYGLFHGKIFWSKMVIFKGNFMRWIDCTHSQIVKNASLTLIQGRNLYIEAKIKHFRIWWENRRFLGLSRRKIDCAHSRTVKIWG
jgi:hypothetical protein